MTLTPVEARILYTMLVRGSTPRFGYLQYRSALHKLEVAGGGECCRDCTHLGVAPHRLGGMVCAEHGEKVQL